MQTPTPMISKKRLNKALERASASVPAIPYFTRRRRSSVMPYILGGLGIAFMGGLAALAFFSPRTRYRALDMAKTTYGKLGSQIGHLTHRHAEEQPLSNGLASDQGLGTSYGATGH